MYIDIADPYVWGVAAHIMLLIAMFTNFHLYHRLILNELDQIRPLTEIMHPHIEKLEVSEIMMRRASEDAYDMAHPYFGYHTSGILFLIVSIIVFPANVLTFLTPALYALGIFHLGDGGRHLTYCQLTKLLFEHNKTRLT